MTLLIRATYPKLANLLPYTPESLPTCIHRVDNFSRPRRDGSMRILTSLGGLGLFAAAALAQAPVATDFATEPTRRPVEPITVTMLPAAAIAPTPVVAAPPVVPMGYSGEQLLPMSE